MLGRLYSMAKKRESKRQKYIQDRLIEIFGRHLWIMKVHGGPFQKAGVGDHIVCCFGYFFMFEVKEPDGSPSEIQVETLEAVGKAGGQGWIIETWEEAFQVIIDTIATGHKAVRPERYLEKARSVSKRRRGLRTSSPNSRIVL